MALWGNIPWMISIGGHSVDIERPAIAVDDLGGRTMTFAVESASVAAWVQPASSLTIQQYGARDIEISHNVFFSDDPEVELGDRIKHAGRYLLVVGIKDAGELDKLWRIDCQETQ